MHDRFTLVLLRKDPCLQVVFKKRTVFVCPLSMPCGYHRAVSAASAASRVEAGRQKRVLTVASHIICELLTTQDFAKPLLMCAFLTFAVHVIAQAVAV